MVSRSERGQTLALMAMILPLVVLPLIALVVESGRWFYVRENLQVAVDAASAAAASQAWDTQAFVDSGEVVFDSAQAASQAQAVFAQVVADAGLVRYAPTLTAFSINEADDTVALEAQAAVQTIIPLAPPVIIQVGSTSQARVARP